MCLGTIWLSWTFTGACFVCVPVLLVYKEHYRRLDIDIVTEVNAANDSETPGTLAKND